MRVERPVAIDIAGVDQPLQRPARRQADLKQPLSADPPGSPGSTLWIAWGQGVEVAGDDLSFARARLESIQQRADFLTPQDLQRPERLRYEMDAVHGDRRAAEGAQLRLDPFSRGPRRTVQLRVDDRPA